MPWTDGLEDGERAIAVTKGWDRQEPEKAAANIFKSYRELEKSRPDPARVVTLPEKEDAPEWDEVFKRLEKPLTARETARRATDEAAAAELKNTNAAAQQAALDAEWGEDKEKRTFVAQKAAQAMGLDADGLKAWLELRGVDGAMKHLYALGQKMDEGALLRGNNVPDTKTWTRETALAERNRLATDLAYGAKVAAGDKDAMELMETLTKAIIGTPDNWSPAPENFGRTKENPRGF